MKKPQPILSTNVNCNTSHFKMFTVKMSHIMRNTFLTIAYISITNICVQSALLYPQFTVFQLVGSISVPITDLPPNRKVSFDWGLQMNYDMPFNVSSFYMVPIWATNGSRSLLINSPAVHRYDFTAKEFYEGIENMLEGYGYNKSCLKRSICELAQNPFDDVYKNIVTNVVTFFLTPSIHQGFSTDEKLENSLYSFAENQGFLGRNCQQLYPQCFHNIFNILTLIDSIKV